MASESISVEPLEDRMMACVTPILALSAIPGADRIQLAQVKGWDVVVKKDEFKVGDLCVYFAIDSVLPMDHPEFAFLGGKRIKTLKMRGVLSQGLAMPLTILGEAISVMEDEDVTQQLGVTKYVFDPDGEPTCGKLPPGMRKTGENRVQECRSLIKGMAARQEQVVVTRKEDGTSTSFYLYKDVFYVCGHNSIRSRDDKLDKHYFDMCDAFDMEKKMRALGRNLVVQGELVGPGIQKNRLGLQALDFRVFGVWDMDAQRKLAYVECGSLCKDQALHCVPELYVGPFKPEWADHKVLLAWADSLEYLPGKPAEGFVVASATHSFKVISNRYLLTYGL